MVNTHSLCQRPHTIDTMLKSEANADGNVDTEAQCERIFKLSGQDLKHLFD